MGSLGANKSTVANRPLSETWRENIPETATVAQRDTLEGLFRYGSREFDYLKLEYTKFDIAAIESDTDDELRKLLGMRKQPPTLQVSFNLERTDREENAYLNALDSVYSSVFIGPRGGMYTYDGNGRRENLSYIDATSRVAVDDRRDRDLKQYERRRRRREG